MFKPRFSGGQLVSLNHATSWTLGTSIHFHHLKLICRWSGLRTDRLGKAGLLAARAGL